MAVAARRRSAGTRARSVKSPRRPERGSETRPRRSELAARDRLVVGSRCAVAARSCVKMISRCRWHCLLVLDDPGARLSDSRTIRGALAAAVMAALGTPAIAADLSPAPPPAPRHVRPSTPHRAPPPSQHLQSLSPESPSPAPPNPSPPPLNPPSPGSALSQDGVRTTAGPVAGWGTSRGNVSSSANFPTDPSGVIGGKEFESKSEFSPNLLTEGELSRSAPHFQFRRY